MDRRMTAALVIGVVVATSAAGFVAGSRITSPAEVASRTAPPGPSVILVPVEERVLSTAVVSRGTARFGSPQKLSIVASALKSGAGLVAELPIAGAEIAEGDLVASGSGRPLFMLVGERPMSRDLGPGLSGDDVAQLEEALTRLGFDVGPSDGVYDTVTEAGVEAWYLANGYAPFTATTEQLAAIRAREANRAAASLDLTTARGAITAAATALDAARTTSAAAVRRADSTARGVDRASAEADANNLASAQDVAAKLAVLQAAKVGRTGPPATAAQIRSAEADLAAARTNELAVRAAGQIAVARAQSDLDQAPARLELARAAATSADDVRAADVAAKRAVYDELAANPATTAAQLSLASSDLIAAEAAASEVHAAGVQSVTAAQQVVADAPAALAAVRAQTAAANDAAAADIALKELALQTLTNPAATTGSDVALAERELAVATANRDVVRLTGERLVDDAKSAALDAAAEVHVAATAVTAAEDLLANANSALLSRAELEVLATAEADLARRRAGVQVPADELVFVATGPVRIAQLLVVIGDPVAGGVMTVTDASVHIDGGLALSDASLVQPGMVVRIDESDLGIATEGVVATVASAPGTNGVDGFHVYVAIDVPSPPTNLVGASVRLTIPIESSGTPVLAVPVSALTLAADGSSRVQRATGDAGGTVTEFVAVTPGLSADGFVGITALDGGLAAGDLVVIGLDQVPPGADATAPAPTEVSAPPGSTGG